MNELEKDLHRLPKVDPEEGFVKMSKERLMHQIRLTSQEDYLTQLIKKWGEVTPSPSFMSEARIRLIHRLQQLPSPLKHSVRGVAYALGLLKKMVASTLVMLIAVMSTLFYVEGNTVVEASEQSYLQVTTGTASVKHADMLAWETVTGKIEIRSGDLIRLKEDSQATVHFFDDTQLRLNQNSTLLISQLAVSPAYEGQGIIEVNLNEGEAWVQTLNVEDGYTHFTLSTPEASVKALHASFNVLRTAYSTTSVSLFDGKADLFQLDPLTQKLLQKARLMAAHKVSVTPSFKPLKLDIQDLSDADQSNEWVKKNLEKNHLHLAELRAQDLNKLTLLAGTLPGDTLYFVKKTKEDFKLAWNGNEDLSVKIDIANQRLNEAIILLESGDVESGKQALMAYQELALDIAKANKIQRSKDNIDQNLANQLVLPHQKFLTAQTTSEATVIVKDTLHKTAEILAETPFELASVKLRNSVDKLEDAKALVEAGDLVAAKLKLSDYVDNDDNVTQTLTGIQDPEEKKKAIQENLDLQEEKQAILASVTDSIKKASQTDPELLALVQTASSDTQANLNETLLAAIPLFPELAPVSASTVNPPVQGAGTPVVASSVQVPWSTTIAQKINIYHTWQGQKNQIDRLLGSMLEDPSKINDLIAVRDQVEGRAQNFLSTTILQLQNQAVAATEPPTSPQETTAAITAPTTDPVVEADAAEPPSSTTTTDPATGETTTPLTTPTADPTRVPQTTEPLPQ